MDKSKMNPGASLKQAEMAGKKTAGAPPPGMKVGGGKEAKPVGTKVPGKG